MGTSTIREWPETWPRFYNGSNEPCDMIVGPCSCGAWHHKGEFELQRGFTPEFDVLYRHLMPVPSVAQATVNAIDFLRQQSTDETRTLDVEP